MVSITGENPSPPSNHVNNLACKLGQRILSSSLVRKRKSGRKKFRETRHPVYRGVRQRKGKWVCEMREPYSKSTRIWLGTFTCPEMAAGAYDVAAVALKGDSAVLNFPSASAPDCSSSSTAESESSTCLKSSSSSDSASSGLNIESASMEVSAELQSETLEVYWDEDEIFHMHDLITSLAEGLMLPPPVLHHGLEDEDEVGSIEELRLWSG